MKRTSLALLTAITMMGNATQSPPVVAQIYRESGSFTIRDGQKSRTGRALERISAGQIVTASKDAKLVILMNKTGKRYLISAGAEVRVTATGPVSVRGPKIREITALPPTTAVLISSGDRPHRATATNVRAPIGEIAPKGAIQKSTAVLSWAPQPDSKWYAIEARNESTGATFSLGKVSATERCELHLLSEQFSSGRWWRITISSYRSVDAEPESQHTYVRFMGSSESQAFTAAEQSLVAWESGQAKSIALGQLCVEFDLVTDARNHFRTALSKVPNDPWLKSQLRSLDKWPEGVDL